MKNGRFLLVSAIFLSLSLLAVPSLADEDRKKDPAPPSPTPVPRSDPLDLNWESAPLNQSEAPSARPPASPPQPAPEAAPPEAANDAPPAGETYTVRRGDTLFQIARRVGRSVAELAAANAIRNPNLIFPGQVLVIAGEETAVAPPPTPSPQPPPAAGDNTYTVRRGDTLYQIARRFGVSLPALIQANQIPNPRLIAVGQVLQIPEGVQAAADNAPAPDTPAPTGDLIWPTDSHNIIQHYRYGHTGIDIPLPVGTEVRAVAAGAVEFAGWNNGGFGNLVVIDHGNGLRTVYAHNSEFKVKTGQTVAQGDVVALSGHTGYSTLPHLHFGMLLNYQSVNPCGHLPGGC